MFFQLLKYLFGSALFLLIISSFTSEFSLNGRQNVQVLFFNFILINQSFTSCSPSHCLFIFLSKSLFSSSNAFFKLSNFTGHFVTIHVNFSNLLEDIKLWWDCFQLGTAFDLIKDLQKLSCFQCLLLGCITSIYLSKSFLEISALSFLEDLF